MARVIITGGSGLVGTCLTKLLVEKGYEVRHLGRNPGVSKDNIVTYPWSIEAGFIAPEVFEGVDYLIHLAGASIANKTWTEDRKKELYNSRIQGTQLLINTIKKRNIALKAVVSASAVGYYGTHETETFTEESSCGNDFMSTICRDWEQESIRFQTELGIRTSIIRIGIVFSDKGGALTKLSKPVSFFAGAVLGSGKQYVSWIHEQDLASMFCFLMENESLSGVFNGVAPAPVVNKALTQAIAHQMDKPLILPNVPAFALKMAMGEMSTIVLDGQRVSCEKIMDAGFEFSYPTLQVALADLLKERADVA